MRKWEGKQKIKKQIYTLSEKVQGIMRAGGEGFVFLMKYNLSKDLKKGSERALWGRFYKSTNPDKSTKHPFIRVPPSSSKLLPRAPPPYTIALGIRF